MKILKRLAVMLAIGFAMCTYAFIAHAATTPSLGVAGTFGILANVYERNGSPAPIINGDLGYATTITYGAGIGTVSGSTYISDATYNQAGTDLTAAATLLNNETCTYNFPVGSFDLATIDVGNGTGIYTPGVYCATNSADDSIGAAGITLSGSGTYVFKIKGALVTASSSVVTLTNGASACDVFWSTSSGSNVTTLGWQSTFVGTLIDPMQVSMADTVTMTGRVMVFGGTVTPASDFIITVPECTPPAETDMCANIDGNQSTVPNGYVVDAAGNCTEEETTSTDMCVNIDGDQSTVPDGYTMDAAGNCTESENMCTDAAGNQVPCDNGEADMCMDATGNQVSVPPGYTVDAAGFCVESSDASGSDAAGHGLAPFTDISDSWAEVYIQQLYLLGVVSGRTSTTFGTNENLTRGEMVKIAELAFGYAIREGGMPTFKDVNSDDWFAKYLAEAEEAGIVGGYEDGTFRANAPVTRAEALKILLQAGAHSYNAEMSIFDRWGTAAGTFTDVDQSAWYAKYVNFAFANGIVNGKSETMFAPNDNVTRGEMSKMAVRATERFIEALSKQLPPPGYTEKPNVRVKVVVETTPGVYFPIIAPAGDVIATMPIVSGVPIVNCPFALGVALPGTNDCSELNIVSAAFNLTAIPNTKIPNAIFVKMMDIPGPFVFSNSSSISNGCTWTAFASTTTPSINCSLYTTGSTAIAISREIQAVYRCQDGYTYDPRTMTCIKPPKVTNCTIYNADMTNCLVVLWVNRTGTIHGLNTHKVMVSPATYISGGSNSLATCTNVGGPSSLFQKNCYLYFTINPTAVTLTATAPAAGETFSWGPGICTSGGGTSLTCTVNATTTPINVYANYSK